MTSIIRYSFLLLCLFWSLSATNLVAQEAAAEESAAVQADPKVGKKLWNENSCGACHNKNMVSDATGPALGGVEARWAAEPRQHLIEWVQGSQKLIASGKSERAKAVFAQWNQSVMLPYPGLAAADVEHLLAYIQGTYDGTFGATAVVQGEGGLVADQEEADNTWLFVLLGVALLTLSLILARVTSNLSYMVKAAEGNAPATRRTLLDMLTSKGVVAFVIFALVVLGGYTTVNNAVSLGRQQDYQPEQPIKFSHATHSGIHKIECQYCHDGARRSKHSVIPAVNTCMNCHRAIKYGSNYGTAEITKIYAAIGYDPVADAYIENYEDLSNDDLLDKYKGWIADNYLQNDGSLDEVENVVEKQLADIKAALTGPDDDKVAGPVQWVRIHNMPDHVYFNHAQHVTVGKIECQSCHGPVEEMELVYQYSPLSMGWCINCHRQTEVNFADNDYYQAYEQYHQEMQAGDRKKVTVEEIGGLSCQRCHY